MNALSSLFSEGKSVDDFLSPILVKELRQGMRSRVFVLSFLLLQVFLVVLVLSNVAAQEDRNMLDFLNRSFWVIIGFALMVLMPMRGLTAVSQELRNRTLETIMLTRLTAWRVVFGKWTAIFAQSLLLVSAVLPYVVLRYFIGGNDVVSDFESLLFLLWLSGLLIAASIAISGMTNPVVRVIVLIGVVILGGFGLEISGFSGLRMAGPWEYVGWLVLFGFFIPALLFEITASSIAPISENHALVRRVLGVLFFACATGFAVWTNSRFKEGVMVVMIILVGICYFELAEKPQLVARMVRNLARKGLLGGIMGAFLLPGWPSALLFSLVVIPAAMATGFQFFPPDVKVGIILPILAVFGSVLTPVVICHLLWRKMNHVLLMVAVYNAVLLALASLLEGLSAVTHLHADPLFSFFPSLPVLSIASSTSSAFDRNVGLYLFGNSCVVLALFLILLVASRRYFGKVADIFHEARQPAPVDPTLP